MGGLFGGGTPKFKAPAIVTPTPPIIEDAAVKAESDTNALRKRAGRASTILTQGSNAEDTSANAATRSLTGA